MFVLGSKVKKDTYYQSQSQKYQKKIMGEKNSHTVDKHEIVHGSIVGAKTGNNPNVQRN
jgi:hypothetical protein